MGYSAEVGSTCFFNNQTLFGCLEKDIFQPNVEAGKQASDLMGFLVHVANQTMLLVNSYKLCDGTAYDDTTFNHAEYDYGVLLTDLPYETVKPWEEHYCAIITTVNHGDATKNASIIEAALIGTALVALLIAATYCLKKARNVEADEQYLLQERVQDYGAAVP